MNPKTIWQIRSLTPTPDNFGLFHNDYSPGNFVIDYSNSDCWITLFDFDACGRNYFMYDLACFGEFNTGWAIRQAEP